MHGGELTMKKTIPADLVEALAKEPAAARAFEALAPSHQREYVKWVEEAKKNQTRQVRVRKVVQQVMEKSRG
jgi:uncharacterized protein YdeI (YjbR/CyaY-like superfamily)